MKRFLCIVALWSCLTQGNSQQLTYTNPILAGFYPDPSICRVGDDYYLTTSSFAYFPGLPIFHSKDLVSWRQIGHAIDRAEQMDFTGAGVSRGLFAPAITNHKGLFYIVCTQIDKLGNFVITATDPKGPWSQPIALPQVNGIDPSLFFDANDSAYIIYNSIPPNNISLHNGHRSIRMMSFDWRNKKVTGEEIIVVNGGTDMSKKPVWIEAPHIFKKDGFYYLICAEGGTGYNHSEVVFRSDKVWGPYVSFENNPILTQRHLDKNRKDPITTTGHADFVTTKDGKWYAVFLGCRPYEDDYYNTGRETFMAPVKWKNGWPVIAEGDEVVRDKYDLPLPKVNNKPYNPFSGNFIFSTRFPGFGQKVDQRFVFLRTVKENWYTTNGKKLFLTINTRPETISGKGNPSFIGFRQSHAKCSTMVSLQFNAKSDNEKAGLTIFQNEQHYYYLCKSQDGEKPVVQLYRSTDKEEMELITSQELPAIDHIKLLIVAEGPTYSFHWKTPTDPLKWNLLKAGVDGKFLSTKVAGGFVGSIFGMYTTSQGKETTNKAVYYLFEYRAGSKD